MTSKELIKHIMATEEVTNADMARALDITQAALWERLNPKKTNNLTISKLNSMLQVLGYEIIIRDKNGSSEYTIED